MSDTDKAFWFIVVGPIGTLCAGAVITAIVVMLS